MAIMWSDVPVTNVPNFCEIKVFTQSLRVESGGEREGLL